ncbi:MAG: type II CRISPR RNA-guided endonuclease Cas9, partial [Saprospiraceae bacterium]
NIQKVTRKHIEKYKLWEETGEISPYTGQTVCLAKLLHGEGFDVEHIIPQARLFDNSFGNKTICERFVNQEKSSQTAFDFMKSRGEQEFNRYIEVVNRLHKDKKISRSKFAKLLMSAADIPDDFINRQLGETRYISRKAVEILKSVCTHVHTTTGSVTAYLRREWGWDLALEKVNIPTYAAQGKTYTQISGSGNTKTRIVDWSKRDDHRHHFVDALTIACTKQAYIQRLNKLNTLVMGGSQAEKFAELKKININAEKPFETAAVMEMLEGIFIAYKPGQNVGTWNKNKKTGQIALAPRGALHKETVYGQIKRYPKSPTKLNKKFINAQFIIDEAERKTVLARLENYQFDAQKALDKLEKNPILVNGKPLTEVRVWEYEIVVKYKLNDSFIEKDIPYIVDSVIKKIVQQRFDEYKAADIKEHPLKSMAQNPIYLNKEKGICINSVRCFTGLKSLVPLHKNKYGEPIDFVSTSKNHHIAIYENENGERNERVVTFWDAVERMKQGIEVVQTEDPEFGKLVLSMQQNEMFVFDMTVTELQEAIKSNHKKIGKNLYRVQKISKTDYYFRQHIATHINNNNQMKRISSLKNLNCIKVHINRLGEIVKIGE